MEMERKSHNKLAVSIDFKPQIHDGNVNKDDEMMRIKRHSQ
jgi:hypothetical protein